MVLQATKTLKKISFCVTTLSTTLSPTAPALQATAAPTTKKKIIYLDGIFLVVQGALSMECIWTAESL